MSHTLTNTRKVESGALERQSGNDKTNNENHDFVMLSSGDVNATNKKPAPLSINTTLGGIGGSKAPKHTTPRRAKTQQDDMEDVHEDVANENDDQFSDEMSSEPSIPDENIDFNLVYAFHTFLATVEGQASVVKGDKLTLLDDSNSYWWLVRVLKTLAVGYIPAENIETPHERLARLNKHKNVNISSATQHDHITGIGSSRAKTYFAIPHHPRNRFKSETKPQKDPNVAGGGRFVDFAPPTYYEHSGAEDSDSGSQSFDEEFEDQFQDEENGFDDDDEDEDDEDISHDADELMRGERIMEPDMSDEIVAAPREPNHVIQMNTAEETNRTNASRAALGVANGLRPQRSDNALDQHIRDAQAAQQTTYSSSDSGAPPTVNDSRRLKPLDPNSNDFLDPTRTTRKVSITPAIAQDAGIFDDADETITSANSTKHLQSEPMRYVSSSSLGSARSEKMASTTDSHMEVDSQDSHHKRSNSAGSANSLVTSKDSTSSKKSKKDDEGKKKKGSGILGGLFGRKKDKKEKQAPAEGRQSPSEPFTHSPVEPGRHVGSPSQQQLQASNHEDSMALAQQSIEARAALSNQFGITRQPGAINNTFTRSPSAVAAANAAGGSFPSPNANLSPPTPSSAQMASAAQNRLRPGSLIGSPGLTGPDAPVLHVLRVFAGDNIHTEATFKTVLLSERTTTTELIRQALQRFRLQYGEKLKDDDYFLSVRELDGEEAELLPDEQPLQVFEDLTQDLEEVDSPGVPKVKRSSVGSISSISSNLTLHPAIAKLGMGDWSDDSTVKIYLNKRTPGTPMIEVKPSPNLMVNTGIAQADIRNVSPSPALRFALRVIIHPEDLPESLAYDPINSAISPRSSISQMTREKIIFFAKNVNVSEVVETALDRFGILEGVVDGGDEVEDKLAKRRSISRVRYSLAALKGHSDQEEMLNPSSRVIDAYSLPPLLKAQDRTSKEMRRRSLEASVLAGSSSDIQSTDPIFVIRRAGPSRLSRTGLAAASIDPRPSQLRRSVTDASGHSEYHTPQEELPAMQTGRTPSRQETIAAQRAASRANQNAMLSASKNANQGVDIVLPDKATIRSSRVFGEGMRYSYIDQDGAEYDISDIMENEWRKEDDDESTSRQGTISAQSTRSSAEESYRSALTSPLKNSTADTLPRISLDDDETDEEDLQAIEEIRSAPLNIDYSASLPRRSSSLGGAPPPAHARTDSDFLEEALERQRASPFFSDTLEQRIDRVLAKVKNGDVASQMRAQAQAERKAKSPSPVPVGRITPDHSNSSTRTTPQPASTPIATLKPSHKAQQSSIASSISSRSSISADSNTTASPAQRTTPPTSSGKSLSQQSHRFDVDRPILRYHENYGLDVLLQLVEYDNIVNPPIRTSSRLSAEQSLFGPDMEGVELGTGYSDIEHTLRDLDQRLDDLMAQVYAT